MKAQIFMWILVSLAVSSGGLLRYFQGPSISRTLEKMSGPVITANALLGFVLVMLTCGWLSMHLWLKFK